MTEPLANAHPGRGISHDFDCAHGPAPCCEGARRARRTHRDDGFPTRGDMQWWTEPERAIQDAAWKVEEAGASPALTDAVALLARARERLADHVEGNGAAVGGFVPLAQPPDAFRTHFSQDTVTAEPAEGEGVGASTRKGEGSGLGTSTPGDSPSDGLDHILEVRETGWSLEHPQRCRYPAGLLDCATHERVFEEARLCALPEPGRYRCAAHKLRLEFEPASPVSRRVVHVESLSRAASSVQRRTPVEDQELVYAAFNRCPCGAGLAYDPREGVGGSWDCSDILTGRAIPMDQPGWVTHTARLPFVFYEIKSERQPSANGATTRRTLPGGDE